MANDPYGPSKVIQQATANLLADIGIQAASLQPDLAAPARSTDRSGPLSRIAFPTGGVSVTGTVTITGTATDAGGTVGGVEISVDGGRTWHPAHGTDRWTYSWQVPAGSGTATLMTRATDDSINVETPGRGINVKYGLERTNNSLT